jgi:aryl-alcohol dehydrogenase-like predicted oxidoreductase
MELRGGTRGPQITEEQADKLLNTVLDSGINFIDTSIDYGLSEERIGKYISHRRSEYFLASKCGCVVGGQQGEHVHTAQNIRDGVENSLRLLKTDHLDLVQFHRSLTKEEFEKDGALQEALKLKAEGKVRFVGVSGTLPNLVEQIEMGVFDAFQIPYSALQREHEDVISMALARGAGTVIRGGVARGAPSDWEGKGYYMVPTETMKDRWEVAKLDELLNGMTRMEFMLRFTLSHPALCTTIVGTSNADHLRDNIDAALKGPLPADVLAEAKRRLEAAGAVSQPVETPRP